MSVSGQKGPGEEKLLVRGENEIQTTTTTAFLDISAHQDYYNPLGCFPPLLFHHIHWLRLLTFMTFIAYCIYNAK